MGRGKKSDKAIPEDRKLLEDYGSGEEFSRYLSEKLTTPHKSLEGFVLHPQLSILIPKEIMKKYRAIPFLKEGKTLHVAMTDPHDLLALDDLERYTGLRIKPYLSKPEEIEKIIKECIEKEDSVTKYLEEALSSFDKEKLELIGREDDIAKGMEEEEVVDHPEAIDTVDRLIVQAIKSRTSDIHFEPGRQGLMVRLRIDGVLHKAVNIPNVLKLPILSRIKIIAGLDIAEKRVPQDGRLRAKVGRKEVDIRVSTLPTFHGEKIVMRILDRSEILIELSDLGFAPENLATIQQLIHMPNGIFLVTGPTGSGKTTTLYACLNALNSITRNIVTTEDPVEYEMELICQTPVNPKVGLTFARCMRSILRQDPDIIMVGEMRDSETVQMAGQAALTGHLVISTLHTNDAPGAITRLLDMGMEPYLICSTLIGVVAQRLVRRVCPKCREPYPLSEEMLNTLPLDPSLPNNFVRGKGCPACLGTGYFSRTITSEIFILNEEIRELILKRAPLSAIRDAARNTGMRSLREDGMLKAQKGLTTLEEVMAVTGEQLEEE